MITHLLPMLQESSSAAMEYSGSTSLGTGPPLFAIAIIVFFIVATWKLYTKAGQPGWAIFVPIYNAIVWLRISGKPGWWVILLIIPVVNFIIIFIANLGLAKNFGKGTGFAIGLFLLSPIFIPILAFSDAKYQPQA